MRRTKATWSFEVSMALPAVAYQTYLKYKNHSLYQEITKKFLKKMAKLRTAVRRARFFHQEIDDQVASFKSQLKYPELIQCKKGCAACCHTQVAVTEDEAHLLLDRIDRDVPIDLDKLHRQARSSSWYEMDYQDRACIFLGEGNNCRVYEDRPSVCRTNFAISDPKFCETKDGQLQSQRLLNMEEANLLLVASFMNSPKNNHLPHLLNELIEKRKNKSLLFPNISA